MAKAQRPEPQSAKLTIEQMKASIPKLERRIKDLETFDVKTVRERFDPIVESLAKKVDGTLQEILGYGTIEYNSYEISSLDTLPMILGEEDYLPEVLQGYRKGIEGAILKLKTLKDLFEERIADSIPSQKPESQNHLLKTKGSKRIFIVHGQDNGIKETVARYLTKLNLHPIILHEQPNQGNTIIEKFEAHTDVEFAVVLFTCDDMGYPKNNPNDVKPRARQNVILELGYFLGALGRTKVCVLYQGDVEIPSDYLGVLYVPFDNQDAWKFKLAREMKSSGIEIDLNNAM